MSFGRTSPGHKNKPVSSHSHRPGRIGHFSANLHPNPNLPANPNPPLSFSPLLPGDLPHVQTDPIFHAANAGFTYDFQPGLPCWWHSAPHTESQCFYDNTQSDMQCLLNPYPKQSCRCKIEGPSFGQPGRGGHEFQGKFCVLSKSLESFVFPL